MHAPAYPMFTGRMTSDLVRIVSGLQQSLSSVSQLTIQLRGEDPRKVLNPIIKAAAMAVSILGPACGPLTHISVSCEVRACGQNTYTPLIDAASRVCTPSLTHLSFSIESRFPLEMLEHPQCISDPEYIMEFGCDFDLESSASESLSSLTRLTHLKLQNGAVDDQAVWAALPASLQSLDMRALNSGLPYGLSLPNLMQIRLRESHCSFIRQLLEASPQSCQLALESLLSPESEDEQRDFQHLMKLASWRASNGGSGSGNPDCTPVTKIERIASLESDSPGYLAPWEVLSAMPTMPYVTKVYFGFADVAGDQFVYEDPVRVLHHIPRAFPNVECLRLLGVLPLDSDLSQLHACTSLCQLKIHESPDVTGYVLLQLAVALPNLYFLEVTSCDSVSEEHLDLLERLMEQRQSCIA